MNEEVAYLRDNTNYMVTNTGRVINAYRSTEVEQSASAKGPKVNIRNSDGSYTSRLVCALVAEAFVPRPEPRFNVVMHLDNDPWNVSSANLVWRPRSYAYRYKRQFNDDPPSEALDRPIEDEYGLYFSCAVEASIYHGLCYQEILRSIELNRPHPLLNIQFKYAD